MGFPDKESLYKGYDWRSEIVIDGKSHASIKEIVVLTGWMVTGLIAWRGKKYVPTKNHAPALFEEVVGGEVAKDFQRITELCRERLAYVVPRTESDKKELLELLPRVLALENYFLEQYQHFLIENLKNSDPVKVRTSIIRLGEIVYPNDLSLKALQGVVAQNEKQEKALLKSLKFLKNL